MKRLKRTLEKYTYYDKKIHALNIRALLELLEKKNFENFFLLYSCNSETESPSPHRKFLTLGICNKNENTTTTFESLDSFLMSSKCFGILAYDLKNEIENLASSNNTTFSFPSCYFIRPETLLEVDYDGTVVLEGNDDNLNKELLDALFENRKIDEFDNNKKPSIQFTPDCNDSTYLKNVISIQNEIIEGNVYELNYCRNYIAKAEINAFQYYNISIQENPTPFSCLVKTGEKFIISSSMERFLYKEDNKLTSQPIKGTIRNTGVNKDFEILELCNSEKDKAENLMIVDLVRNDLNRCSIPKSVTVDELFGIYSYKNVHQMISTVSSKVLPTTSFSTIIKSLFPMGSMTGAPKISAMNFIEKFENFKRGVYSGAIGYVDKNGDFDFNVVIRTVLFDRKSNQISLSVGSAITIDSIPEKELEECKMKIEKLKELLNQALVN